MTDQNANVIQLNTSATSADKAPEDTTITDKQAKVIDDAFAALLSVVVTRHPQAKVDFLADCKATAHLATDLYAKHLRFKREAQNRGAKDGITKRFTEMRAEFSKVSPAVLAAMGVSHIELPLTTFADIFAKGTAEKDMVGLCKGWGFDVVKSVRLGGVLVVSAPIAAPKVDTKATEAKSA